MRKKVRHEEKGDKRKKRKEDKKENIKDGKESGTRRNGR